MRIKLKNPKYCDSCPCLNSSEDGYRCNLDYFNDLNDLPRRVSRTFWSEANPTARLIAYWEEHDPSRLKKEGKKVFIKQTVESHIRPQSCIKKQGE